MRPHLNESEPLLSGQRSDGDNTTRKWIISTVFLSLIVVTFFLSYMVTIVIYNPYIFDVIAKEFPEFNGTSRYPCLANMSKDTFNSSGNKVQEEIFRRVATIELYLNLSSYLLAIIPILVLGPVSDRYGRKISFIFAVSGTMMKQAVYMVVINLNTSPYWLLLGHLCDGLGGSFAGMITSMFSAISDLSPLGKRRSCHIAVTEAMQTISASAGQILVAQWIKTSYIQPLSYGLTLSVLCLCLIVFSLPETSGTPRFIVPIQLSGRSCCSGASQIILSFYHLAKKSLTLYIRDEAGKKRLLKRRMVVFIFFLTVAVNFSLPGVQSLYLMKFPLCWSATKVNTYYGASLVCHWVAILLLLALLRKVFNMSDHQMAILGAVSSSLACAFLSVATNDTMVYEVAVLNVCTRVVVPMLRSVMSGLVDSTEQGAIYASMGCIETIAASVFSLLAYRIFTATLSLWPGCIFAIFAFIMIVVLILLIILNIVLRRERSAPSSYYVINSHHSSEPDPSW